MLTRTYPCPTREQEKRNKTISSTTQAGVAPALSREGIYAAEEAANGQK